MSAAVEGATTMSSNHNFRPISTIQQRATKRPGYYEVAEALREIGRGTTFLPQQIEVDAPIHLCFKSYHIEMVRQVVRWALENPDTWLKLHPKQHTLAKKTEALQVRMGVHPNFTQPLLRDRSDAFGAAVGKSDRTIRGQAAHMIEAFARILVDSPGRLVEAFLEQSRPVGVSGLVSVHSVVSWRRLSAIDVGVYFPVAAPHITTSFEVELPADDTVALKPKTEVLQEVKVQGSQVRPTLRRRFEGVHLEAGSRLELSLRRDQSGVAISSGDATRSEPTIFGTFGTGLDLHQSLYFQEGSPPIECYSVEVQSLPDGRWKVGQLQSENEELEELSRVAKTWKRSRLDTYYGFFVLWDPALIPPMSTYISKYFDKLHPDFHLQVMQSDNAQAAIA